MPNTPTPSFWVTIPCKGRLASLRETLPRLLAEPRLGCCVVDYDCPDACGAWAKRTFASEYASGRLLIETMVERPWFNKSKAHNAGLGRVLAADAQHVAFLDADTLIEPNFLAWLWPRLDAHHFWIAGPRSDGRDEADLFGFLVVPATVARASGGYDEAFEGWGGEDLEYRLRLHLGHGLTFSRMPLCLLRALPHSDSVRTRFYAEKNPERSNLRNQAYLAHKLRRRFGLSLTELPAAAVSLWGRVERRTRLQHDTHSAGPSRTASCQPTN